LNDQKYPLFNRRLGDKRARQVAVLSGSFIILVATYILVPWIGLASGGEAWVLGGLWLVLMLVFDVALGRVWMKFSWRRILSDFNPVEGGFLAFGMLVLLAAPYLVLRFS
jgi:hypothetical protein